MKELVLSVFRKIFLPEEIELPNGERTNTYKIFHRDNQAFPFGAQLKYREIPYYGFGASKNEAVENLKASFQKKEPDDQKFTL